MAYAGETGYRWFILALACLTNAFVVAVPSMCIPVLFQEISEDLGLSLVQLGAVWGMIGLAGIFTSLAGGLVGDHFGTKRTVATACILAGFAGASRGLAGNFTGLAVGMFASGVLVMTITLNVHKIAGVWFSGREVVIANGVVSAAMALGFMLGAMVSDTIMSPLLGGWRNVLFLYGLISLLIGLFWLTTRRESTREDTGPHTGPSHFPQILSRVVRIRAVWTIALVNLCYSSGLMGFTGYLPLYLRGIGWKDSVSDGALAAFNAAGMLAAIPLTLLSSRLGSRRLVLMPALIIGLISLGMISVMEGEIIWVPVVLFGLIRDGYYAILATMVIETPGVGPLYAGTAIGVVWTLGNLGNFIGPPIGNTLADLSPRIAFLFWAVMVLASVLMLCRVREERRHGA